MTEAESPANPLGRSSAFTVTLPFLLSISVPYSITLSHLVDNAFADLSHVAALIPTREIVVKEQLLFLIPYRADDVLIHDVRDEELRQPLRVNHLLAGLFHTSYPYLFSSAMSEGKTFLETAMPRFANSSMISFVESA